LRYFNVFGPRQDPYGGYACLIPKSIDLVKSGKSPEIYGDGEQTRDFTYVKDAARGMILALNSKKADGEAFNISGGRDYSIKDVAMIIKEFIPDTTITITESRKIDVRRGSLDISKARKILGYEPKYDLREGIRETIKWFLDVYCPTFEIKINKKVKL